MKTSYTTSPSLNYMMTTRANEQYPRYTPIDIGSELPENFTIWPPTPQLGTDKAQPAVTETFTYSLPEDYSTTAPAWDASVLGLPDAQAIAPHGVGIVAPFDSPIDGEWNRQVSYHGEESRFDRMSAVGSWNKPRGDYNSILRGLDSGVTRLGSSYGSGDESALLDSSRFFPYSAQSGFESDSLGLIVNSRRLSDASTSLSSQEALVQTSSDSFDECSHSYDVPPPLEYSHHTSMSSSLSSTPLSPVMSPRQTARPQVRSGSRSRSSPSPRPSARSAPYIMESPRNKRWSTGSYYSSNSKPAAYLTSQIDSLYPQSHGDVRSHRTSPTCTSVHLHPHQHPHPHTHSQLQGHQLSLAANQLLIPHSHAYPPSGSFLPSSTIETQNMPPSMMGYPSFRGILGSNVEPSHSHYSDLTDPPELYSSLQEEQIPPPPEDMNPEDPDMKPHEQDLRFEGDLYTPRWVRGHGNKREGWCGICKPGRWLVLKNSAFWYDKSFTHGISAATGQQFVEPKEVRRMDGNPDVWEGLCHSCNEWVALVSNKKKGTTWFRHAYKCHTHPKIKDTPKRRRESSHNKTAASAAVASLAASSVVKAKQDMGASASTATGSLSSNNLKSERSWR
ncbi:hypothetical protein BDZ91DRAFT_793946 [Kalaharituber pfeilii]|nr:hypothetical protein BDZ91DRAFT_793946 [Kalaharituber pfeilii]